MFVERKHFSLGISVWPKKLQCKILASFVISFFCYFVTPLFSYSCMNSSMVCLGENTIAPYVLCGLADWKIQQADFLADLWVGFTVNGLINQKMPYCSCLCARKHTYISPQLLRFLFLAIDLLQLYKEIILV